MTTTLRRRQAPARAAQRPLGATLRSIRNTTAAIVATIAVAAGGVACSSTAASSSGALATDSAAPHARSVDSDSPVGAGEPIDFAPSRISKISSASAPAKIKAVQYLLNAWGARPNVVIDGKYGSATTKAVKAFQHKKGLEQDGKAGPITMGKLIVRRVSGDRGKSVQAIQVLLNHQGASLRVDGSFGSGTRAAVKAFQRTAGIEQDGKVGPVTWTKLFNRTAGGGGGGAGLGSEIASLASRELGNPNRNVERGGKNCNYYTGFWGLGSGGCGVSGFRSEAWCSDFAKYIWYQAGAKVTGLNAWAPNFRDVYGRNNGTNHRWNPKVGDAVTYDWRGDGVIDHVEIVTAVSGSTFTAIGGNTGDGTRHIAKRTMSIGNSMVATFTSPVSR